MRPRHKKGVPEPGGRKGDPVTDSGTHGQKGQAGGVLETRGKAIKSTNAAREERDTSDGKKTGKGNRLKRY